MTRTYRLAGRTIEIDSLYPDVHKLCEDYCADGPPDLRVKTGQTELSLERERAVGRPNDGYLETLAVYRAIAERLPGYDTILFHGSAIAVDGAGYLFTAPSGTGKSTHARLWRALLGSRAVMVNDDKPLIRLDGPEPVVCGTPWNGKHRLSSNIAVPLRALALLERAEENRVEPLTPREAWPTLLRQTYRPEDPAMLARTLDLVRRLATETRLYRLGCNMDPGAARLAYDTMRD